MAPQLASVLFMHAYFAVVARHISRIFISSRIPGGQNNSCTDNALDPSFSSEGAGHTRLTLHWYASILSFLGVTALLGTATLVDLV